jgi:hypothetical protein
LAEYLAASGAIGVVVQDIDAAVVANTSVQPFGINGTVDIDFNNDSQVDFQIDHDRYNLNGTNLDYLQIDKNDVNGETNPLPVDSLLNFYPPNLWAQTFPVNTSPGRNNDAMVLSFTNEFGDQGGYVVALEEDDPIGGMGSQNESLIDGAIWDWQEGSNFNGSGRYIRANRLIDEDHGQIDADAGRQVTYPSYPIGPNDAYPELDGFTGLPTDEVRYIGVRLDFNDAGYTGNEIANANGPNGVDNPANYWYGWIGIRITNPDDATGEVVGYAYESVKGMPILAGDVGTPAGLPGDYNNDTVVDAVDYTLWRNNLGDADETAINFNGDGGGITASDYTWWKQRYGDSSMGSGGLSLAVPEPSSLILCALGACWMIGRFLTRHFFRGR